MAPRSSSPADDDDLDAADDEEEPRPRRKGSTGHRPARPKTGTTPVRRWKGPKGAEDDEDELDEEAGGAPPRKKPTYWRARDSLYFEPLVALAIIVLLIVGMYAYTQNWPPIYVVESDSMQHGSNDVLGLINTGDLVLAQKVPAGSVVTYVNATQTGYSTYGEYGDVVLYYPNGQDTTPIIHRAILFLSYNSWGTYNLEIPASIPCGSEPNAVFSTPGTVSASGKADCGTSNLDGTLDLFGIGWKSSNVSISLSTSNDALGHHAGFLTMGDNNFYCSTASSCVGLPDQGGAGIATLSELVEPGWVIGVARGMVPWFGAIKLWLEGNSGMVPSQSWEWMGLTIAALILLAFGIHYALRAEGIEDPRRRAEEEEEELDAEEPEEERPRRGSRFLRALQPWRRSEDEEDEIDRAPPKSRASGPGSRSSSRRGRPPPRVKRAEKPKRSNSRDDDDL